MCANRGCNGNLHVFWSQKSDVVPVGAGGIVLTSANQTNVSCIEVIVFLLQWTKYSCIEIKVFTMACYLTLPRQFLKIIWTLGNPFWHCLCELHCLTIPSHTHTYISASRSIQQRWSIVALPWRDHVQWEHLPPGGRSYSCWLNYSGKKDWILRSFSTNMGAKIIHAWNHQGVDCWWGIFENTVKRRSIRASSG